MCANCNVHFNLHTNIYAHIAGSTDILPTQTFILIAKMALCLFFLASLTFTYLPLSWSYRDGARSESCYNMLAMHTDFLGQVVPPTTCGSPCHYQLRMVGRVVGENNLTVEEENPTTYQCGEVYQCK